MKKLCYLFFLFSIMGFAQQSAVEKVTAEICDSLSHIKKPLHELTSSESKKIVTKFLIDNITIWKKDLNDFKQKTGKSTFQFDQYFQHILQIRCEKFRILDLKLDSYLNHKKESRTLYLKAKEFVISIEDNESEKVLFNFLNDNLKTPEIADKLKLCKTEIDKIKSSTILSMIMVYMNGYTLRVEYYHYITNDREFGIDINFSSNDDLLIDNLIIRDKETIMKEKKENNGMELMPPPPPPPIKKE